jgi:DNA-binding LacI/PurR family transcriptional regulator
MRQPLFEIGWTAAEAVMRMLDGEAVELPSFVPELVVRESTARVASPRRRPLSSA